MARLLSWDTTLPLKWVSDRLYLYQSSLSHLVFFLPSTFLFLSVPSSIHFSSLLSLSFFLASLLVIAWCKHRNFSVIITDFSWNISAEAVNNMGGLGFNGYDENGKAKWNRVTNANILKIEVRCFFFLVNGEYLVSLTQLTWLNWNIL